MGGFKPCGYCRRRALFLVVPGKVDPVGGGGELAEVGAEKVQLERVENTKEVDSDSAAKIVHGTAQ